MTKSDNASDNADEKKLALTHMRKLKRAAVTLSCLGFPVYGEEVRAAAEFIRLIRIDVAGDIEDAKADFTNEHAVRAAINVLNRLKKEAQLEGRERDFYDTGYGVRVIEALRDTIEMLEQSRKTITQLQVPGEVADKELMDLRLELTETKALLNESCGVVGIQLGIIENLSSTLNKVTKH
jgi:hypothetical protein